MARWINHELIGGIYNGFPWTYLTIGDTSLNSIYFLASDWSRRLHTIPDKPFYGLTLLLWHAFIMGLTRTRQLLMTLCWIPSLICLPFSFNLQLWKCIHWCLVIIGNIPYKEENLWFHFFTPQPSRLEGYCCHDPGGRAAARLAEPITL